MTIIARFIGAVGMLIALALASLGQVEPPDVHAKLLLAENKSAFRIGEPIKLVIEFTADREGYQADTFRDDWLPANDVISVTPATGFTPWLEQYTNGVPIARDVTLFQKLSRTPVRVEVVVNDSLRFDRPGKYSIHVTSIRAQPVRTGDDYPPPIELTTNDVNIEVQPMSDADELKEVMRLSKALEAARGWQAEEKIGSELACLTGDISSREKLRRFLNPEGRSGNYAERITRGLFISRNRDLVLRSLETALRDPNTPVTHSLFQIVARLRLLSDYNGTPYSGPRVEGTLNDRGDPRLANIQRAYITELVASLNKRVGKAQTTTAMTMLGHLAKDLPVSDPAMREVRTVLIEQFASLGSSDQDYLLQVYWDKLRDSSLVPALEKMLNSRLNSDGGYRVHNSALKALLELAPDKGKQYAIVEICDPRSMINLETLESLTDNTLPEVDTSLLKQITQLSSSTVPFDQELLRQKSALAARYATENIYRQLLDVYRSAGDKLRRESRAVLLAYFVKHNESEGLALVEETLTQIEPGQDFSILPPLTSLYYSEGIDRSLRKRLDADEPEAASTAAYLISLHAPSSGQKVIEARLERWLKEWRNRPSEADSNYQGILERELIMALGHGKSWTLSPERLKELQQGCVTTICRQTFRLQ